MKNNLKSLTLSFEKKVDDEVNFYKNNNLNILKLDFENIINNILKEPIEEFYIYTLDNHQNIDKIKNICKEKLLKYYTVEEKALFIISSDKHIERYCHSFKIKDKYSINDCRLE